MTGGPRYYDGLSRGWPPALAKAAEDPFTYAAGLRSGAIVVFDSVEVVNEGWVVLLGVRGHSVPTVPNTFSRGPFSFERGFEVRVDEIVWVADAPFGS